MAKSKWFCIAVEGATATDNRVISAQMLTEMATNYNRATYGARVNIEHVKGINPKGDFKAQGDVLDLETRPVELEIGGKKQKLTGLFAQIEPTAELVETTDAKQKIYTSMEIQPNFAKTGKFGLLGVAATDTPASLGTDILKFSATSEDPAAVALKAMFDGRKTSADSFFSAAYETSFELEPEVSDVDDKFSKALASFGDKILASFGVKHEPPPPANDPADGKFDAAAFSKAMAEGLAPIAEQFSAATLASDEKFNALQADFNTLKGQLEQEPRSSFSQRKPATGGDGRIKSDC